MNAFNSENTILETLQAACSQDANILKPAEMILNQWEIQPGFYSVLLKIFANQTINFNIRWLAALYFKNGIDKYWRKNAPNCIAEDEKLGIRNAIISSFNEPVSQIAVQLAVIIAKIARFDCPREWPELMPTLMQALKNDDSLQQHRALLSTHHVIKSLSSKRLTGDKRLFQELTENIFPFILSISNEKTELYLNLVSSNGSKELIHENLEKALLTLRILRKLSVFGIKKPHESEVCMLFLKNLFLKSKMMLDSRAYLKMIDSNLVELCEKYITHLTKILLDILQHHPFSFIDFIQPALEFCIFYAFTPDGITQVYERFIIQCLNIIKGIVMCIEYKHSKSKIPDFLENKAAEIKEKFFTPSVLTEICNKLVTHYFLLTSEDLAVWDSDPESFSIDEIGESWKYNLRSCTETLFTALIHEYKELAPIIMNLIQSVSTIVPSNDLAGILKKDAVYNAVGLSAFFLFDQVDFDSWFVNILAIEIQNKDNNYRIVRRAAIKLIGQWTGVKFSYDLRPNLYSVIITLLTPSEDMAVKLAAANTLKQAVDDFEFNSQQFLPYLESIFGSLFQLLKEANECDTKMQVLHVLSFVIERVELNIRPYADSLIQYLPMLWEESSHHNMLRCAIVSTLVRIIKAFTAVPQNLYGFVVPVIMLSTDLSQESHIYLIEDGLDLWLTVLENSIDMTPGIFELCERLQAILESSSETMRMTIFIIQAYVVLAPEMFLQCYGNSVMNTLALLISDLRTEGIIIIMRLLDLCLQTINQNAIAYITPLLPFIIEGICTNDSTPQVISLYLAIISRILLLQPESISEVLSTMINSNSSSLYGKNQQTALGLILDTWLECMSSVTQPERRKLLSLALSSLITAQSDIILDRICGILMHISETLNDIMKEDEDGTNFDSLIITPNSSPAVYDDGEYETEHDRRRKRLSHKDSVHTVVLKDYLQTQITTLQTQVGLVSYQTILDNVDSDIKKNLKDYITL